MRIHFCALALIIALFGNILQANEVYSQSTIEDAGHPYRKGADALYFSFVSTSYSGIAVSWKHHLDQSDAIRFDVSADLGLGSMSTDSESHEYDSDVGMSDDASGDEGEYRRVNTTTAALFLRHLGENKKTTNIFYGAGPYVEIGKSWGENVYNPQDDPLKTTRDVFEWGGGLTAVLGFECFINASLSIKGEYGISGGYSSYKKVSTRKTSSSWVRETATTGSYVMDMSSTSIGFSFYF